MRTGSRQELRQRQPEQLREDNRARPYEPDRVTQAGVPRPSLKNALLMPQSGGPEERHNRVRVPPTASPKEEEAQ